MARGTAKVNAYPCCECCLTDPLHPDHREVSCPTCNNPTADRLRAERDALAAKLDAVREWIDRRGVNVDDRDDEYMRGYRDAQRHALLDAVELRRALDGEVDHE